MVITNQGIQRSEPFTTHNCYLQGKVGVLNKRKVHRREASLNTLVPLIYLNKICINIFF